MLKPNTSYMSQITKQANNSDLSQFPLLSAFIEKMASEDMMEKSAMWLKVLRGLKGSKAAQQAMKSKINSYIGDRYAHVLDGMPSKGYPSMSRSSGFNDPIPARLLQKMRKDINPGSQFDMSYNLRTGERYGYETRLQQRGGLFDEFMGANFPSREQYGILGKKGTPARFSVDRPGQKSIIEARNSSGSATYSPTENAVYDGFGNNMYKALSENKNLSNQLGIASRGQKPSLLKQVTRRHELSHWKQSDLPMEQLSRNARYADVALSKALREQGLKFGSNWDTTLGRRPQAIIEAFNNVQASVGPGNSATRFRSFSNYNPEYGWNLQRELLPNTLLYNGRAGVNQAAGNYLMPMVPRPTLP